MSGLTNGLLPGCGIVVLDAIKSDPVQHLSHGPGIDDSEFAHSYNSIS